jgi:hypothetical protein
MSTAHDSEHPTTTHAERGEGNPRLIFIVGSENWDGTPPREFPLLEDTTRIGSGPDSDLQLDGLNPLHAEIVHDENDEYILVLHGAAGISNDLEEPGHPGGQLHTGARVDLGDWKMTFAREEFADHGRPFGGREGGEFEHQESQPGRDSTPDDGGIE